MDGNEYYDPLLGHVAKRLEDRAQSGSSGKVPKLGADARPPSEPLAEAVRNACHALNLHDVAAAGWLYWVVSTTVSDKISPEAFKQYRDILIEDAGNPSDPIEIMLIEQLALAHFSIGRLQVKACSINNAKLSIAYSDATTRLLGEFRRCSLALEDYRAKQAARQERSASNNAADKKAPAARNGKPRPSDNRKGSAKRKKEALDSKLTTNGKVPECIRQRMGYATNGASRQTVEIGGNGKG